MKSPNFFLILFVASFVFSCEESNVSNSPTLNITFVMDSSADRLDNLGNLVTLPDGNAGQHPDFETLGLHFIGLYPDKFTPYDGGSIAYLSPTTTEGGSEAIDFEKQLFLTEANNIYSVPLNEINSGTYEYFRGSIGYQQYKIIYNLAGAAQLNESWPEDLSDDVNIEGTVASFLGFNNYIENYTIENQTIEVNSNKLQGYFGLESAGEVAGIQFNEVTEGDAPQTTVPNPIDETSPVPEGSCVVTGRFPQALVIPEKPTEDINIQVVISINNSFEWEDDNNNGKYEPLLGEKVVDMGTRGVFPIVVN